MTDIKVVRVSSQAQRIEIPEYPPLSDENLDKLVETGKYGLAVHRMVGIDETGDPLPVHIHPATWLSLIQEVRRWRAGEVAE